MNPVVAFLNPRGSSGCEFPFKLPEVKSDYSLGCYIRGPKKIMGDLECRLWKDG